MSKLIDLVGQTYGELTVLSFSHTDAKHSYWNCKCLCGLNTIVRSNNLRTGNTSHCENPIHRLGNGLADIAGQQFNRLTAIELNRTIVWKGERTFWDCLCICSNITTVESGNLKSGHTKSCGCYLLEQITTHGCCAKDLRLYGIWRGMIDRCENENHISFAHYGKRGICVSEKWHDVQVFFEWAYANGYTHPLTIERKDVYSHYQDSNCTWIPLQKQARNTTVSLGEEKALAIRQKLKEGAKPKEVASLFNCAYTTIISIKNYDNYKDLP